LLAFALLEDFAKIGELKGKYTLSDAGREELRKALKHGFKAKVEILDEVMEWLFLTTVNPKDIVRLKKHKGVDWVYRATSSVIVEDVGQ
jgi:DNA-binding PadR family transcriptional regulator